MCVCQAWGTGASVGRRCYQESSSFPTDLCVFSCDRLMCLHVSKRSCTGQGHDTGEDVIFFSTQSLPGFYVEYKYWRRALTSTLVVGEVEVDQEVGAGETARVANCNHNCNCNCNCNHNCNQSKGVSTHIASSPPSLILI